MINKINNIKRIIPTITVGMILLWSCTKEKVPTLPSLPEPTFLEKVSGYYKVYDTTGVYLYDMNISHKIDSLHFENFDGEFAFTVKQSSPNPINYPNYVRIGVHDTLYDSSSKRWKLGGSTDDYYNNYYNDTLPLRFQKTNINYYIQDVTPYYACDCKQIAVKQH